MRESNVLTTDGVSRLISAHSSPGFLLVTAAQDWGKQSVRGPSAPKLLAPCLLHETCSEKMIRWTHFQGERAQFPLAWCFGASWKGKNSFRGLNRALLKIFPGPLCKWELWGLHNNGRDKLGKNNTATHCRKPTFGNGRDNCKIQGWGLAAFCLPSALSPVTWTEKGLFTSPVIGDGIWLCCLTAGWTSSC